MRRAWLSGPAPQGTHRSEPAPGVLREKWGAVLLVGGMGSGAAQGQPAVSLGLESGGSRAGNLAPPLTAAQLQYSSPSANLL